MRFRNFFRCHLLDDFFLADRRVGIAADGAENVPHIGADQVGRRQSKADLVVPADTRLRARMPLHGAAQIPIEGADRVTLDPKAKCIHHPDQFLGIGIARPGRGPKRGTRLLEPPFFHQVARLFDLGAQRRGPKRKQQGKGKKGGLWHAVLLFFSLSLPAAAEAIRPGDFLPFDPAKAEIGQLLFYDKILSGNRNISCGTCHHHDLGGTDGLSLGIGEGGEGVGNKRHAGLGENRIRKRIPRNAPALWNLGHRDVTVLFHDGRLSVSDLYGNGFNSPAEEWLPQGLDNILAAQALFPLVAQFEMAGNPRENEVAGAVHDRIDAAWPIIAERVRGIPAYAQAFAAAFAEVESPLDITGVQIANALGAFINSEWRSFDSPYDAWLTGTPLPEAAERGRQLFFGEARCVTCHSGPLFSDQKFHALGLPAFGPGRTRRFDPMPRDVGRMGESDSLEDAYRFRTLPLRNVALTAPYGHNGAYATLEGIVRHHLDPVAARAAWARDEAKLPPAEWLQEIDFVIQSDSREMARQAAVLDIEPIALGEGAVADLVAFLEALTGETALKRPLGRPESVPSGLRVD